MADIKISQLPQTQNLSTSDILPSVASGVTSKITVQDLANSLTQVSSSISASYALTASYSVTSSFAITASYALTSSYALDAALTASNAITRTGSAFELGGQLYKNTYISGTKDGTLAYGYPTESFSNTRYILPDNTGQYLYFLGGSGSVGIGGIAKVNINTNQIDSTFNFGNVGMGGAPDPGGTPTIYYGAITSAGKIYIGGYFTSYNNVESRFIARLNSDGTLDTTFNIGAGFSGFSNANYPYTVVMGFFIDDNNKLLVHGSFTSYSGSACTSMVRINEDGTRDTSFTPPGFNAAVITAEKAAENKIYCAGVFFSPTEEICRLNNNGSVDNTFVVGSGFYPGYVTGNYGGAIAVDSQNRVVVIGNFTSYKGTPVNRLIRINPDGNIDTSFNPGGSGFTAGTYFNVYYGHVKLDEQERIYITGTPTVYNGVTKNKIFRLLPDGALDTEFYTGTGFTVSPISAGYLTFYPLIYNNNLYVGIGGNNTSAIYSYNGIGQNKTWKININENLLQFSKTVLAYDRDESPYYTSRSLVDKAYVDGEISAISTDRIASGSATASISPGLLTVNTNALISGSLNVTGSITASNALFTGTITAQTLVVQTVSSSVIYSSGSNIFGDELTDVQQFTGSVRITGSLSLASGVANMTSSWAVSSSQAVSSSFALTASYLSNYIEPFPYTGSAMITGSLGVTGSFSTDRDATINSVTVGRGAGNVATNTAVGSGSLFSNTIGCNNTAIGNNSLQLNNGGSYNTSVGSSALLRNSGGSSNTVVGHAAMYCNTTGFNNTAVGVGALLFNNTGFSNTAFGLNSLRSNTSGLYNTAVGFKALACNTIGKNNTALGTQALENNTTGVYNIAVGRAVLTNNKSGRKNTAVGDIAMNSNYAGSYNTAVGNSALGSNTTGNNNTAVGNCALRNNTSGVYNVAVGFESLRGNNTGNRNTAVGYRAACLFRGSNNVVLGGYTGSGAVTASNNNIFIADGAGNLQLFITGSTNLATFTGAVSASGFSGSIFGTSSWAINALTASSADNFTVRQNLTGSNALFTGTITAQTLVVQTVTSSVIYSSGSNIFGDELTDIQQFTGSVRITGSLSLASGVASMTSSWAVSSSQAISASYAATASVAGYSGVQESQYRFQNTTVIDQDVWLNSGSIVKVVTSSGVSTAEYSINGGSYTAFTFTGDTWTGNIAVVPKDTLAWRITYRSGFTTGALVVVSNITVS